MISLRSELRRKVLTFFYVNRSARVYVRQLAVALGVDSILKGQVHEIESHS